jgi:hypothetical protein
MVIDGFTIVFCIQDIFPQPIFYDHSQPYYLQTSYHTLEAKTQVTNKWLYDSTGSSQNTRTLPLGSTITLRIKRFFRVETLSWMQLQREDFGGDPTPNASRSWLSSSRRFIATFDAPERVVYAKLIELITSELDRLHNSQQYSHNILVLTLVNTLS